MYNNASDKNYRPTTFWPLSLQRYFVFLLQTFYYYTSSICIPHQRETNYRFELIR